MDEFKTQLINALEDVVQTLGVARNTVDFEWYVRRLQVLAESALSQESIPLDVVDRLNEAANHLKSCIREEDSHVPYQAPIVFNEGRRGRPRFFISEDQLVFFRGTFNYFAKK